jgi:hypothetical protein
VVKTLSLAAGLAVGYVLGARAGREKYDQLAETARRWAGHPAVTRAQAAVTDALATAQDSIAVDGAAATTSTARPKKSRRSSGMAGSDL